MRFVSILFCLFILLSMVSAQTVSPVSPWNVTVEGVLDGAMQSPVMEASAPTGSRAPFSVNKSAGTMDTLADHFKRSSAFTVYSYTSGTSTFPVVGSNNLYLFVGEKFPFSGSANVLGFLFACNMKVILDPPDSLGALLFLGNATNGLPTGTNLEHGTITMDKVDTNRIKPVFTYIAMRTPTQVTGPFVAMLQTRRLTADDDIFAFWSNTQGDGPYALE